MQGFQSWRRLQRFVDVFYALRNLFVPPHPSRKSAIAIHLHRLHAVAEWNAVNDPAHCTNSS